MRDRRVGGAPGRAAFDALADHYASALGFPRPVVVDGLRRAVSTYRAREFERLLRGDRGGPPPRGIRAHHRDEGGPRP